MKQKEGILTKFLDPLKRMDSLSYRGFYNNMDDEKYLRKRYRLIYKRELHLNPPVLFNEKMQWLKLYDRNPLYTKIADKYQVKNYITEKLGEGYIIPTLGLYEKFGDINFSSLPNQFVIKTNHDSGGVIICKDKKSFNKKKAEEIISRKMKKNYFYGCREWCYKNIKPMSLIEPFLCCENNFNQKGLIDYKFYCFSGVPLYVMASFGEAQKQHINHKYDMDFRSIDRQFRSIQITDSSMFRKPENFEEMISVVRKLCAEFPHIRIDLYNVRGKIYVGEMTLYSNGGFVNLPLEMDRKLGDLTDLNMAHVKKG